MPTVAEAATNPGPLASALAAGVDTISQSQTVTFTLYLRVVLPIDGFVFWVKAQLLSPSAQYNSLGMNFAGDTFNASAPNKLPLNTSLVAQGSLHYATKDSQNETDSVTVNQVIFTSEGPVNDLNAIGPNAMYIATLGDLRFAFSERRSFYQQANLYHYAGNAVYSTFETQIIDNVAGFDTQNVIVSNSLPLWLNIDQSNPPYPLTPAQKIQLYPSYLVPENVSPPYGSVDISQTTAIQATPIYGPTGTRTQLVTEQVKVTLFGTRNFNASDFLDYVLQYSLFTEPLFGIQNMPVIVDEKLTQVELQVIAQKKTILFTINYYQQRMRDLARQLILQCIPTVTIGA